jgi:hypothetical protein
VKLKVHFVASLKAFVTRGDGVAEHFSYDKNHAVAVWRSLCVVAKETAKTKKTLETLVPHTTFKGQTTPQPQVGEVVVAGERGLVTAQRVAKSVASMGIAVTGIAKHCRAAVTSSQLPASANFKPCDTIATSCSEWRCS